MINEYRVYVMTRSLWSGMTVIQPVELCEMDSVSAEDALKSAKIRYPRFASNLAVEKIDDCNQF